MGTYYDSFDCQVQCEELPGYEEYEAMQELLAEEAEPCDTHEPLCRV